MIPTDDPPEPLAPREDPQHWLYRLGPEAWLAAAEKELLAAQAAFVAKNQRAAVAQARRAAGMALNAVLWHDLDPRYGRSYMDHLQALRDDPQVPAEVQAAAAALVSMPLKLEVVVLGRGQATQADPAARIVAFARAKLQGRGA